MHPPRIHTRNFSVASTVYDDASPVSIISTRSTEPWLSKGSSLPWDDRRRHNEEKGSSSTDETSSPKQQRQPWHRLGLWGFLTILNGTIVTVAILAFLIFLWTAEGVSGSEHAPPLWRWVMLGQRVTQTVTFLTVLIRIAVTTQAAVFTSLMAGIMLENYGVPLSQVAEFSVLRSINDGPVRLAWLLLTSSRRSPMQATVAVLLVITTIAIQFSSTILVSDLDFHNLVGESVNESMPVFMTNEVLNLNHQSNNWLDRPTAYVPFGEIASTVNSTPTEAGMSDTGVVRRVFLPVPQEQRERLRRYRGQSIVLNSRYVCIRPVVDAAISAAVNTVPGTSYLPLFLSVTGSIDYRRAFVEAGLPFPRNCPGANCFPTKFNCTLPQLKDDKAHTRQGFANSICLPDGRGATFSARNFTLSNEPVPSYAGVFLFLRNNGTLDLWRGPDSNETTTTFLNGAFPLRDAPAPVEEWISFNRAIGGRFQDQDFVNGAIRLDMSLCFQQVAFDESGAQLSSPRDLRHPSVSWDSDRRRWDTTAVRRMIDNAGAASMLPAERGIFTVEWIGDARPRNMATYFTNKLVNQLYNSPQIRNVSVFMDPLGVGLSSFLPHVEYQVLFSDILNSTNRPGLALQSTLTALSGSVINEAIPQFNAMGNVTLTTSAMVMSPRRAGGLVAVVCIVVVNMACGAAVLTLFFLTTGHSTRGNYWQVLSQAVSEQTGWVLEDSSELADWEVEARMAGVDPDVRIARCERTGRVHVVLASSVRKSSPSI